MVAVVAVLAAQDGLNPATLLKPGTDSLADLQRRLLGPAIQHADRHQRDERQGAQPGVALHHTGRRSDQIYAAPDRRHPLLLHARSRLRGFGTDRPRDLALRLAVEGGQPPWQPRHGARSADTLYFETPDCHLVALEMKTGEKKWDKEICDMNRFYYASVAPVIVKNQVIAGVSGDDMDNPGYLQAHDPLTRRDEVALVHGAAEDGRPWLRDMAERGGHEARRRHDVDAGDLRSGSQPDLRDDRQSSAGHRPQEPSRRQPVHRVDRRAQRRHREDGVVLPVVAARHPRLGRRPDAACSSTERSTASRGSFSRRLRATVTSSCSTARTARRSSRPSSSRRTGRSATTSAASRSRTRRRCRRSTARWSRRTRAARRTGSLRRSARRPACSTSTRRVRSACTTSTIRATTRLVGEAPTVAATRSRCSRLSTTRPARSGGVTLGRAAGRQVSSALPGNLVFSGGSGGIEALNATTGEALWHARIGTVTNAPITYELDGEQHVVVASGSNVVAFVMNK